MPRLLKAGCFRWARVGGTTVKSCRTQEGARENPKSRVTSLSRGNFNVRSGRLLAGLLIAMSSSIFAQEGKFRFDIPQQSVQQALLELAQQAEVPILIPFDAFSSVTANELMGEYSIADALGILLAGTNVRAQVDQSGQLIVEVVENNEKNQNVENGMINSSTTKKNLLMAAIAAALAGGGSSANAQTQAPAAQGAAEPQNTGALEEIHITGSRITRSDDFSEPLPMTVFTGEFLDALGVVNTGDAIKDLPGNVAVANPTSRPQQNFFNGSNLINLRGLNPYYGTRTLTLVDSRRHVPTNQADSVDLNFIPTILIEQVEIVTGGASASYGSGAIAGVNNILLNHRLDGGKAQVDFGTTAQGDGNDRHIGLAWGSDIGDNGHFIFGYEGQDMDAIPECGLSGRNWCARNVSLIDFGTTGRLPGQPQRSPVVDARRENISPTGVIRPSFIPGLMPNPCVSVNGVTSPSCVQFNADGTSTLQWNGRDSITRAGGDGAGNYDYYNLRANVDRDIFHLSYEHQLTDSVDFFVEGNYGTSETVTPQRGTGAVSEATGLTIRPDNAFLQQAGLGSLCTSSFLGTCTIDKEFAEQITEMNVADTKLERFLFGFDGSFGDTDWNWNTYYQYGKSDREQEVRNTRRNYAFLHGLDAVYSVPGDPTSEIVCRVTRDGPNNAISDPLGLIDDRIAQDCVPLNIFGTSNLTEEGLDYAWGRLYENTVVRQHLVEGVASGPIWEGFGAGPVLAAVGTSWREEKLSNLADLEGQPQDFRRNDYGIRYGESFGGDVDVLEYFAELIVPVTETLEVQAAARRSEYENTAGLGTLFPGESYEFELDTWKISGTWQPLELLGFRSSFSRDARAPNFRDLYFSNVTEEGALFGWCDNPWTGVQAAPFNFGGIRGDACTSHANGGLGLSPETSDTKTFGIILTPFDWNLRFAADWYNIELEDAIVPANQALTVRDCYIGIQSACDLVTFAPGRAPGQVPDSQVDVILVKSEAVNFRKYEMEGIDFSADWSGDFSFGRIATRVLATRSIHQYVMPNAFDQSTILDIAGVTGTGDAFQADFSSAPDWTGQWILSYARDAWTATLQGRYVNQGKVNASWIGPEDSGYDPALPNSISSNRISSYAVWNLNGSYAFEVNDMEMEVFGNVQNLFDRDPPLFGGGTTGTNPLFYDTVGRNYRVGLRMSF